jgi:hypothetical protein
MILLVFLQLNFEEGGDEDQGRELPKELPEWACM